MKLVVDRNPARRGIILIGVSVTPVMVLAFSLIKSQAQVGNRVNCAVISCVT